MHQAWALTDHMSTAVWSAVVNVPVANFSRVTWSKRDFPYWKVGYSDILLQMYTTVFFVRDYKTLFTNTSWDLWLQSCTDIQPLGHWPSCIKGNVVFQTALTGLDALWTFENRTTLPRRTNSVFKRKVMRNVSCTSLENRLKYGTFRVIWSCWSTEGRWLCLKRIT